MSFPPQSFSKLTMSTDKHTLKSKSTKAILKSPWTSCQIIPSPQEAIWPNPVELRTYLSTSPEIVLFSTDQRKRDVNGRFTPIPSPLRKFQRSPVVYPSSHLAARHPRVFRRFRENSARAVGQGHLDWWEVSPPPPPCWTDGGWVPTPLGRNTTWD